MEQNFSLQTSHSTYKHVYINAHYVSCIEIFLGGLKYILLSINGYFPDEDIK